MNVTLECIGGPLDGQRRTLPSDQGGFYLPAEGETTCPTCGPMPVYHGYTLKGNPQHFRYAGLVPEEQVPVFARIPA